MIQRFVYLHGFASSPGSNKAQALKRRFAAEGRELEIPDLAAGSFSGLTVSGQLAVVERTAAGEPVSLIGSSLGGYLAALYAARHPEVTRLVLMAPAFGFANRWRERLGEEELEHWRRNGFFEVFHYGSQREERLAYEFIEDADGYEEFPEFRQPTLILHGRYDEVVPVELSRQFVQNQPHIELRILESDHGLSNRLDEIWDATHRFLLGDCTAVRQTPDSS